MHHRILAVENPMIRVGPFNPHAGFVAGDNPGLANNGLRFIGLDLEARMGADEHVHQRAFANAQAKSITEHATQTLVGKRLRPERRRRGDGRRRSFNVGVTMLALASKAPVADDIRLHRRYLDLVISPISSSSASDDK